MKKEKRQKKILELIAERSIGTQEELTKALLAEGCQTTQATVSRDIREMGLRKVSEDGRGSHYVAGISGTSTTYRQILSICSWRGSPAVLQEMIPSSWL